MKFKRLGFTFYKKGEVCFLEGEPLIKGAIAKLLLYMLRAYLVEEKSMFFLSELRHNQGLGSFGNLETRLERLASRLEIKVQGMTLIRKKGCRWLHCSRPQPSEIETSKE